jgi:hypothetical protein
MADLNADRRAMAEELADRLAGFKVALQADVSESLAGFAAERVELHRSLAEMAQIWRAFAAAMRGRPAEKPPVFVERAAPAPEVPVAPPSEAEDVAERVLSYLAGHPEGAKLVELEPLIGLSRPQLGRYLRHLVDSGKVVKDPETLVYKLA